MEVLRTPHTQPHVVECSNARWPKCKCYASCERICMGNVRDISMYNHTSFKTAMQRATVPAV
eukprot:1149738-Pelagomonas_calceolata.AAC.4